MASDPTIESAFQGLANDYAGVLRGAGVDDEDELVELLVDVGHSKEVARNAVVATRSEKEGENDDNG